VNARDQEQHRGTDGVEPDRQPDAIKADQAAAAGPVLDERYRGGRRDQQGDKRRGFGQPG
jgi:hypothetical protein